MFEPKFYQRRILILSVAFALSSLLLPLAVSAQTVTGTLQGTVTDSRGAVVPGVEVVVHNLETGQERNLPPSSLADIGDKTCPGCFMEISFDDRERYYASRALVC
ncbi:MAG: hypothetical protein ACR2G5_13760 [Pyrinomonadaceae bacterium]